MMLGKESRGSSTATIDEVFVEVVDGEDTADSDGDVDEEGEVSGTWALDVVKGFLSAVVDGLTFVVVLFVEIMVDKIGTKFVMGIFLEI